MTGERALLVLASASPRRAELLEAAGLLFRVEPSHVDEELPPGIAPKEGALLLAARKARAVARGHAGTADWVLGADTIVALPEPDGFRYLGKPASAAEATGMLRALSGTTHRVVTGVCAVRCKDGAEAAASEMTLVTMRAIRPDEVDGYVASGEWRDKAGGYAIQESADRFVTALAGGGFDNVVGLPVALALALLERLGFAGPSAGEGTRRGRRPGAEDRRP